MDASLSGLGDLLTGSLLGAVGLLALVLSLFRQRGTDALLASFGAFSLLYGVRLFFSSELVPALGLSRLTASWINSLITYLIQVPAWFFFWKLLGEGWHRSVLWWLRIMIAFAMIGVASDLIQGTPGTLSRHPNNELVLIGMIVAVVGIVQYRGRMTTDLRILFGGLAFFSVFVINDNLVSMELLPWNWREESIGFVIFVTCLGVIAGRRFIATERDLSTVGGELTAARRIQASILPTHPPLLTGVSVAARFQPTSAVAGDFYDFLTPGPDQLGIVVADASGHGVPAALIASMVKVAFSSQWDRAARPVDLLTEVNRTLCGSFQHGFVTAAYVFLDTKTRELLVSSAGHPLPLLKSTREPNAREVGGQGPILGRFASAEFRQETLTLEKGDRLVLYTDGIVEARNFDGEVYGEDRLKTFVAENVDLSAHELCDSLLAEIRRWSRQKPDDLHDDDLTLVVMDFQGESRPPESGMKPI